MDVARKSEPTMTTKNKTTIERKSDRELVVTRVFNAPARIVFEAWTTPELFKRWWVPKSLGMTLLSYDASFKAGGTYRLVFKAGDGEMAFFGTYLEVTPYSRLVWTNDEDGPDASVTTTVTFEEIAGGTRVVVHERAKSSNSFDAWSEDQESFEQLDELLLTLQ